MFRPIPRGCRSGLDPLRHIQLPGVAQENRCRPAFSTRKNIADPSGSPEHSGNTFVFRRLSAEHANGLSPAKAASAGFACVQPARRAAGILLTRAVGERPSSEESYSVVAVFEDRCGNEFLVERK
jgi:hypothetical protein